MSTRPFFNGGKLLTLCLMTVALFACHARVNLDDPIPSEAESCENRPVSFSCKIFRPNTRAAMTEDELLASNKLITAKNLRIVFYNLNDEQKPDKVAFSFDREFEIYRGKASGKDLESFSFDDRTLHLTGSEIIPMDDYAIVYFTSPTTELIAQTQPGKTFMDLLSPISIEDGTENGALLRSIYSNVDDPLILTEEQMRKNGPSKTLEIAPSNLKALNGLIYVSADAVMNDGKYYIPKNRSLYLRLNATNKSLIVRPLFQKVTLADAKQALIPIDKNYDTSSLTTIGLKDELYYHDAEKVFEHNYFYITFSETTKPKPNANWILPVPENTVSHASLNSNTVTRLLLFVPVYPKALVVDMTDEEKEDIDTDWIKIGEKEYLAKTFRSKYEEASLIPENERSEEQQTIILAGRNLAKLNPDYADPQPGKEPAFYTPKYNVHTEHLDFYFSGLCYYAFPIRHFNDDQQPDPSQDGRYGIVRNTLYYYHISGFASIGASTFSLLDDRLRVYDEETEASLGNPTFSLPDYIGRTIDL